MARLDNAVTVVTGAGGGVGRQAALRLAAEGSRVGLTDLGASSLKETASLAREAGGGSVVNVSSIGALAALPNIGIYCASKAAVLGLTRSLAMEYAPHNVRANILCPGLVDTQMAAEHQKSFATPQDAIDALAGRQMLKRYAQPVEIAEVIVFLISKEASFMTGATVPVEAGWTAR
ncbi:hypothetical protein GCM10010191_21820 [Actinomadura vinacea]|uniref:SDR family oxidoreductase n=1 Tax=Actinomadura vinacea TaxID=115336 RepID=A0ABN3IS89_9ACTN